MKKTKEEVRSRITALEADIASLKSQISAQNAAKNNLILKQKKSTLPREIENLQEEIYHIDLKIDELNSRIDDNKKRINRLLTEMTALVKEEAKT